MEWADDIGSGPAAWSYVPVQSSPCSFRVFYRTLVIFKGHLLNLIYNNNEFGRRFIMLLRLNSL